jgi:hypothetical protein
LGLGAISRPGSSVCFAVEIGFGEIHPERLLLQETEVAAGQAQREEQLLGDGGIHVSSVDGIAHSRRSKTDCLPILEQRHRESHVDLPLRASHTQATRTQIKMMAAKVLSAARRSAAPMTVLQHVIAGANDQAWRPASPNGFCARVRW